MKRIVLAVLLVMAIVSAAAFANGPTVAIGFEPSVDSKAVLGFGWNFDSWTLLGSKSDFSTWAGRWALCALWTPPAGFVDVRIGPEIAIWWDSTGLFYNDLSLIVGAQKIWGAGQVRAGIYGQLEFNTNYGVVPELGVTLDFPIVGAESK